MSERIDVNKTNGLVECIICQSCYFLDMNFRHKSKACNDGHGLVQKAMNFNDVAIFSVKEHDYRIHKYSEKF